MAGLDILEPRLAKLIPRLATDHDGEVVATVRAIRRALAADGLDLHDLVSMITFEPKSWPQLCDVCLKHDNGLSDKERAFLRNMRSLVMGGEPSTRQARWLRDIYGRVVDGLSRSEAA